MRGFSPYALSALQRYSAHCRSSRRPTAHPIPLCNLCDHISNNRFLLGRKREISTSGSHRQESHAESHATSQKHRELVRPQNFYELFIRSIPSGPPPHGPFTIDPGPLRAEFLQLQARAHPDRNAHEDKDRAQATSAYINEAYKTLQNPLARAQYLLSLKGIDVANDETAKTDDMELLMNVLDTREQIEEVQSEEELLPLKEANRTRIQETLEALEKAFKDDDLVMAEKKTTHLRYWMNIQESLDYWEKGKPVVLTH